MSVPLEDRSDEINALKARVGAGWLSNVVWNTRNELLAWPGDKIGAQTVRGIIEGFLDEIATLRPAAADLPEGTET